jgi:flavin-binding protein dodecin
MSVAGRRGAGAETNGASVKAELRPAADRRARSMRHTDRVDTTTRRSGMSVYNVVEIIGTSTESWEEAALTAVKKARETIRDLRVAEVVEQDLDLDDGGGVTFRTKVRVSFKYAHEA